MIKKNCNIATGLHSDHSIISIEIGKHFIERGKGFWKFNTNLLHDTEYTTKIKSIIQQSNLELTHHSDKGLIWEIIKL